MSVPRLGGSLASLTIIILFIASILQCFFVPAVSSLATIERFMRIPTTVYSGQAVLVLAKVIGDVERVELSVTIKIEASAGFVSQTFERGYTIMMLPIPWAPSWYLTAIPGLFSIAREPMLKITSSVEYRLLVNGMVIASDRYTVLEGKIERRLPPLVLALVYNVLKDGKLINETLGLGPRGWVLPSTTPQRVLAIAFDESGFSDIGGLSLEYSVNSGPWQPLSLTEEPLLSQLRDIINDLNRFLQYVGGVANVNIPKILLPLLIAYADIPGQSPGNYVMFRATAVDIDGNSSTSPPGLYYVVNGSSGVRILIVDPHVKLWVLQEGVKNLIHILKQNVDYGLPDEVVDGMRHFVEIANAVASYGATPFHHWELLGKYYNLYIAWPDKSITDLLRARAEGGFEPRVIILSNLWLGYGRARAPWNWDLRDVGVLDKLISYVRENHIGIIATHGTLSDWIVWTSCRERQKIGSRGHIGNDISDANPVDEKTIAALLGMPHLALWEFIRDEVAYMLCRSNYQQYGVLVGSIPLQIPYVPFNGTLRTTKEGEGHELLRGLPAEFEITIPSIYRGLGFRAYTEVGWQLAFPGSIAYVAWLKAKKVRPVAESMFSRLSMLVENMTGGSISHRNFSHIIGSLEWGLHRFYRSIASANITPESLNTSIYVPALGRNISISLNTTMFRNILQLLPAKVVALSPDALAGIVIYDKYWDERGYRSVYFSFEIEASNSTVAEVLLRNAVEWVIRWGYRNITELLRGIVRVPKDVVSRFEGIAKKLPGREVFSGSTLLVEEGFYRLSINISSPGTINILIVHPTTSVEVVVLRGFGSIIVERIDSNITRAMINATASGTIEVGIRAHTDASINPAYILVKYEEAPPTATTPLTTTTPTTTAITTIMTTTTIVQTTTIPTTVTQSIIVTRTATETITKLLTVTETKPVTYVITVPTTVTKTITTTAQTTVASVYTTMIPTITTLTTIATPTTVTTTITSREYAPSMQHIIAGTIIGLVIGVLITFALIRKRP